MADEIVRPRTSDSDDPQKGWTSQHLLPERDVPDEDRAYPVADYNPNTRFHPEELPNPEHAIAAGLPPQPIDERLIDEDRVTQSPLAEGPLDRSQQTTITNTALDREDDDDDDHEGRKAKRVRKSSRRVVHEDAVDSDTEPAPVS